MRRNSSIPPLLAQASHSSTAPREEDRTMTRRTVVAVTVAAVALALAAPPTSAQTPKRGGVIRIAEREAPSLDPHLTISFLTHSHMNLVYSQLVRFPHGPE